MQAERYDKREERVELAKGRKVSWRLSPNYGWLTVKSEPAGLEVKINGRPAGRTPLVRVEQDPGIYEVLIESPCHYQSGKRVELKKGEEKEVSVAPSPREGAVEVTARDKKGNDLEAEVYIDGVKVGETPGRFKANVCAREIEVKHQKEGTKKLSLSIEERKVAQLEVILEGDRAGLVWIYSAPAGIEFTRSEVTVAQYRACIEAGKCTAPRSKSDDKYCNWGYTDRDNHPVSCVDWHQATAFCAGAGGRLPTEQEWEKEASNKGTREYPWGNQQVSCDYAVWRQGGRGCGRDSTWPVCSKPKGNSASGLCDMSGNVWEWTSSSEGYFRVLCGGSWSVDYPGLLRAARRARSGPTNRSGANGFRCGRASR